MPDTTERFIFRGNAMPFGGRVNQIQFKRRLELVRSAPSSALSISGGFSEATSDGSKLRRVPETLTPGETVDDVFEWGKTIARSIGGVTDQGHYVTTVFSSVAQLRANNPPHRFEAKLLEIEIKSDHPPFNKGEPSIVPTDITFRGLYLDNKEIIVRYGGLNNDLTKFPTFAAYEHEYRTNQNFFNECQASLYRPAGHPANFGECLPRSQSGYVSLSFVKKIIWNEQTYGHVLELPGFGKIYFGEVLINETNRRVTLVRFEMGSANGAEAGGPEADPNGSWNS